MGVGGNFGQANGTGDLLYQTAIMEESQLENNKTFKNRKTYINKLGIGKSFNINQLLFSSSEERLPVAANDNEAVSSEVC